MAFRLHPVFIKSEIINTPEALLQLMDKSDSTKGETFDFYATSKQYDRVFIGRIADYMICCNGNLAYGALDEENPLLDIKDVEAAAIIWDETSAVFGFSIIRKGMAVRKVLVVDGEIECNEGEPVAEELAIDEDRLFDPEEKEEILEEEGPEGFAALVQAEKICRATNAVAKRYLGTGIVELQKKLDLHEYC